MALESNKTRSSSLFKCQNPHALTPKEQEAVIREALANEPGIDSINREAIGKNTKIKLSSKALDHKAATLLASYAEHGCPVDCGEDWTKEHIELMLRRGPHKSARSKNAISALQEETYEKVKNGYAKIVRYGDIKQHRPKKLKISPVAMIPHKSRLFRTILDLSFRLKYKGKLLPSVNSESVKQAPAESMAQLGNCLQRIITLMADNYDPYRPFLFAKLDIKDGFWRIAVNDDDAWNFSYVLPSQDKCCDIDNIKIVVPNSLQMGWCESPPFFVLHQRRQGMSLTPY